MSRYTKWMWLPNWKPLEGETAVKAVFLRKFLCDETDVGCIQISADSKYKLYVNDVFVNYGPARGDRQVWFYDEIDLSKYIHNGMNTIRVEVLYYQNPEKNANYGIFHTPFPGLFFDGKKSGIKDLEEEYHVTDSLEEQGAVAVKWFCRLVPKFHIVREADGFAPLMIMEKAGVSGNNGGEEGWLRPVFYEQWQISNEVAPGNLLPRPIPFMYLKKKAFKDFSGDMVIPAGTTKVLVLDAKEEETGFIHMDWQGGEGAKIEILYSECYYLTDEEGTSYKGDRTDSVNGHLEGFSDHLIIEKNSSDGAMGAYEPVWFRTFRYIQITVTTADEALKLNDMFYWETGYPLEVKKEYEGENETLKNIWEISLRTLKRCMQETYTDCPFYEQLQYVMDTRSQMLYTYAISGDDRLAKEGIRAFARSQRYDGLLNAAYPSTASNVIPGFSLYFIFMLWDHMNYFEDDRFLKEFLGTTDRILGFFDRNLDERGLVKRIGGLNNPNDRFWSFIDWTKEWDITTGVPSAVLKGSVTMESLLYIMGLEAAADINCHLHRKDTASEYRFRAGRVREAVKNYCTGPNGMIADGPGVEEYSQHCQVFAVLSDTVSFETGRKNLEETIVHEDKYAQCSVAMMYYLFRALEKVKLYKYADKKLDIYRWMLDNHLTTCVEDNVAQRSDCHAWGALPLYELTQKSIYYDTVS